MVGYMRRNFLVPVPSFESFDALNAHLERRCLARMDARLRGHSESIGQRMERDLEALLPLPPVAYDACEKQAGRVSSLSLVRYRTNDYSAPVAYGHRDVLVKGYVDRVVVSCGSEVIARHHRSYQRDDFVFDPVHYLPLLEQKTAALDQAAPLQGWDLPEEFGTLRRLLESRMGRRGKRDFVQVLRLFEHFFAWGGPRRGSGCPPVGGFELRRARFPAVKSLDTFDFTAIPSVNKALVMELARCEYVQRRENIIAVGNSGTGKTHIALGLGLAACQRGMSVGFTTAAALVHELMEARDERRLLNLQRQLSRLSLLIIDELGFVPLSPTGAELLFEVFSQRYERGSILVTTNLPFDEWTEVFGSERLTGALLDRLTHHVHILEMNGDSYRLKRSRESAVSQPSDEPEDS